LRLEVTETIFRDGTEATNQRLHALKLVGIGLVVDDFGTGYSSLDSFASSPFDAMKVDRSLVKDIDCNPRHRAIVNTIARFAEELGMELTVEGVERESQRAHLLAAGCVLAQGFLYAKALPAEAFFLRWQAQIAARPQAG
jgi:EAL domain-containing protein (putative c-di-GMP-specific phosphodiesterase class I)